MIAPSYGVVLQGVDPPAAFTDMVREIESLDYSHLWLTDSSLHARNSYVYLTLAAVNSSRLRLGTAVTNPVSRHPAITAVAAATLDEVSAGRAILGIGAGDRPLLALGRQPCSAAALADAIGAIRSLLAGDEVTAIAPGFALDHAKLRFGARPGLPIFVSASGPRTLELAGGLADGVILLVGLFTDSISWALEHIDRGAAAAGRPGRTPRCSPTARSATTGRRRWPRAGRSPPGSRRPRRTCAASPGSTLASWTRSGQATQAASSRRRKPQQGCCLTASSGGWPWRGTRRKPRSASEKRSPRASTRCTCSRSVPTGWPPSARSPA